jgi:tetratricopeptide (TPR) repeat protein
MLVTLPCVLLLLDIWPLGRWQHDARLRLIAEKLPLLGVSFASCLITYVVQQQGGAVQTVDEVPLSLRLMNVPIAYLTYLKQTFWPTGLAIYYPLRDYETVLQSVMAGVFVVAASLIMALVARKRPYLFVGWFWWLGMLVPVIGLVQVGSQAYADRYMYLPQIGLLIATCWSIHSVDFCPAMRWLTIILVAAMLLTLGEASRRQVRYWRDSETVWRHSIELTGVSSVACTNLGTGIRDAHEAAQWLKLAIELAPDAELPHINLARVLVALQDPKGAGAQYREVLRINPANAVAYFNLGVLLDADGDAQGALEHYRKALEYDPGYWRPHFKLAKYYARRGDRKLAERHFAAAARGNPELLSGAPVRQ